MAHMSVKQILAEKEATAIAERAVKERYWDKVAENLLQSPGEDWRDSISKRATVTERKSLVEMKGDFFEKRNKVRELAKRFREKEVSFSDVFSKLANLSDSDRSVKDLKVLLVKAALGKVLGGSVKGMEDEEIKEAVDRVGDVRLSMAELGRIRDYIRAGYGKDSVAKQFIDIYMDDVARDIIKGYLGQLM